MGAKHRRQLAEVPPMRWSWGWLLGSRPVGETLLPLWQFGAQVLDTGCCNRSRYTIEILQSGRLLCSSCRCIAMLSVGIAGQIMRVCKLKTRLNTLAAGHFRIGMRQVSC